MQSDLDAIAAAFSAGIGEALLARLTCSLAELLSAEHVFIGRLAGDTRDRVEMISYCECGEAAPNRTYQLANTPCEDVIGASEICVFAPEVWRMYPKDQMLVDLRAQSYIGTPIRQSLGTVIGLMAVIARHPIGDVARARALVQLYAGRAALEMERMRIDNELLRLATSGR